MTGLSVSTKPRDIMPEMPTKKKEHNRILSGGKTTIHNLHLSSSVSAVRKNAGKKRTAPTASGWHKKLTTHLICAMLKCIKETSHK